MTAILFAGLSFRVSNSIQFWASKGADGISFLGIEGYAQDRYYIICNVIQLITIIKQIIACNYLFFS